MINGEALTNAFRHGKSVTNMTATEMLRDGQKGLVPALKSLDAGYMAGMMNIGRDATRLSAAATQNVARGVQAAAGIGIAAAVYNGMRSHPVGAAAAGGIGSLGLLAAGSVLVSQLASME